MQRAFTFDPGATTLWFDQTVISVLSLVNNRDLLILGISKNEKIVIFIHQRHCGFFCRYRLDDISLFVNNSRGRRGGFDLGFFLDNCARPCRTVGFVDDFIFEFRACFSILSIDWESD